MSECDTCKDPGYCCRGFELNWGSNVDVTYKEYKEILQKRHPYFVPINKRIDKDGQAKWTHTCTRLGEDGRCMEYEKRPELCVRFEPKSSPLCIMHDGVELKPNQDWESYMIKWYEDLSDTGKSFLIDIIEKEKANG